MKSSYLKISILILILLFSEITLKSQSFINSGISFPGIESAAGLNPQIAFVDIDNDEDYDIILAGRNTSGVLINCYRNDGHDVFTPLYNIPISWGVSSLSWGDYNNDTYIDFVVSGSSPDGKVTKIYRNNGNSTFTEESEIRIDGTTNGSSEWGDYDNDGRIDLVITGSFIAKIFHNNGDNTFTEQTSIKLTAVDRSSAAWGDYDNDGYLDLIITGLDKTNNPSTELYHNDGNGNLIRTLNSNLPHLYDGSVEWGDFNNDGLSDLILTGINISRESFSAIYSNIGDGTFTLKTDAVFPSLRMGSTSSSDFNHDGKLDVILTGLSEKDGYSPFTRIFRNDGNTFTEISDNDLPDVSSSNVIWGDYKNQNVNDILVAGNTNTQIVTYLYANNDPSAYNTEPDSPENFTATADGTTVHFSWDPVTTDITPSAAMTYNLRVGTTTEGNDVMSSNSGNSGYRRIVSYGNVNANTSFTMNKLRWGITHYASIQAVDNGFLGGPFSDEIQFVPVAGQAAKLKGRTVSASSLLLTWERGNGDGIIIFAKEGNIADHAYPQDLTTYFANPVFGEGSPLGSTGWYCVYKGKNDSTIVNGLASTKNYIFHIIEYQGLSGEEVYCQIEIPDNCGVFSTGIFSQKTFNDIPGNNDNIYSGSIAWGDYNNNGFNDLFIAGRTPVGVAETRVYFNREDGTFYQTIPSHSDFAAADNGFISLADIDNDRDLDLLISGLDDANNIIFKLYINDSNDNYAYTETSNTGDLQGVFLGSARWCDYDNDGDADALIFGATGDASDPSPKTTLYRNDNSNFTSIETKFTGIYWGSGTWFDYNNDGRSDVIISGLTDNQGNRRTILYKNEGQNKFTEQTNTPFPDLYNGSVDAADYDKDGYKDLLITGSGNYQIGTVTKLYRNEGNGTFSEVSGVQFTGITGKGVWCDYDNDGFLDVVLSGKIENVPVSKVYHNNGNNSFTDIGEVSIPGGAKDLIYSDYDNDGDNDFVYAGDELVRIYKNNLLFGSGFSSPNNPPAAPEKPVSVNIPEGIKLTWESVTHDETTKESLSYNVKIGTSTDNCDILSPSSLTDGFRTFLQNGNSDLDTFLILRNLPVGKYYWRVQALDQAFSGGPWSEIGSFEIRNIQAFYDADEVCLGYPTHFTDKSVATDGISSWYWDFGDGSTSSERNPQHTYSESGTYLVKLEVTDIHGEKDILGKNVIVKPKPLSDFTAPPVCQGTATVFTNTSNNNGLAVSTWFWDFGDGQTSILQNPAAHGYLGAADYTVQLKALASNGCRDSVTKTVTVANYPVAAVTADAPLTFCKGDSVTLSVPLNADYNYTWKTNGVAITGASLSTYSAKLTGDYTVDVINTKGNCLTTSSTINITAHNAPVAPLISAEGNLIFCQGDSATLSVPDTPDYSYQWKLNGGAVGTNLSQYNAKSSGNYSLTVTNSLGCFNNAVNSVDITVNQKPSLPAVTLSGPTTFCTGSNVELSVASTAGYSYQWENNNAAISGATSNNLITDKSGIYTLKVTNANNCFIKSENITVNVLTVPSAPTISAASSTTFCQGDSVILSVTNTPGYSYQWRLNGGSAGNNSNSFAAKTSGSYDLVVANSSGCAATSITPVIVTVKPLPVAGTISLKGDARFCKGGTATLSVPLNNSYSYSWKKGPAILGLTSNTIDVIESGRYSVELALSGCTATTESIDIDVINKPAKPDINKGSYKKNDCLGESPLVLSVDNIVQGYTYQWYKNETPITTSTSIEVTESANYYLEAVSDICTSDRDTAIITFNQSLAKPVINANGPTVWILSTTAKAAQYKWYYNGNLIAGANTNTYIAGQNIGTYRVAISNDGNCFSFSDTRTIPDIVGVEEPDPFSDIRIYPNPTAGLFTIEMNNNIFGELVLDIYTQNGSKALNIKFDKTTTQFSSQIDLSGQNKGMYLVNLSLDKYRTVKKVVVE